MYSDFSEKKCLPDMHPRRYVGNQSHFEGYHHMPLRDLSKAAPPHTHYESNVYNKNKKW